MIASFCQLGRKWLLIAAFAAGSVHAADHWIVARTPHFELFSDASDEKAREVLVGLENFRANFLRVMPIGNASEPRTQVMVFRTRKEFDPYRPLYKGKPRENIAGYFQPAADEVMVAMTTDLDGPESAPMEVIYHEYVHLLVNTRKAHYPPWLNEGLAEVFSTFRVENGKVVFGEPKNQHVALLQQSNLWPLSRLFAVTPGSPDYNEDGRVGTFYAESWALVHYLLFGVDQTNSAKLSRFATMLDSGGKVPESFRAAFGVEFVTLESALQKYLHGGSAFYRSHVPLAAQSVPVTFRPASNLERDTALLDLRWRIRNNGDAAAGALALLNQDPKQPRPHELLAAIDASAGDMEGAHEHWQLAADCHSDNTWVYLQLLNEALGAYKGGEMIDLRLSDEQVAPWRMWVTQALALSPENPEVIDDALTVEAIADKMDLRVINRLQGTTMHSRDRAQGLLALAIVHWRYGQAQNARDLLDLVDAEPRADMAVRAADGALRYRLPAETEAKPATSKTDSKLVIAVASTHQGEAAKYLDTILAERGTIAPPVKLDQAVVRPQDTAPEEEDRTEQIRQSALAGESGAMFSLALAYARGAGVEYSPALALEWLQQAVVHGYAIAPEDVETAQKDGASAVLYLRNQAGAPPANALPPLDSDLAVQAKEAAKGNDRQLARVIYRGVPSFPQALAHRPGQSQARLVFVIRANGHPDGVKAHDFSDADTATAAEAYVRSWRFVPTIRDNEPIDTLVEITVVFDSGKAVPAPKHLSNPS